jgi:prepilin-type N-terminal cleavage/methylation domain-containing protein
MKSIRKNKKAFTLIELLVVIAIIAILAAILFPVFAQAKLAAKKTSSLSNIKQLDLGLIMYTNDYDDTYGDSMQGSGNASNTPVFDNWATDTYPYIKSGNNHPERGGVEINSGGDGLFQDSAAPTVQETPTGNDSTSNSYPNYQWGFGYGVNVNIMVSNAWSGNPSYSAYGQIASSMTTTSMATPSDSVLLMTKGVQNTDATDGSNAWTYPYFVPVQREWIGPITDGHGNVIRDGDESAINEPGTTLADGFYIDPNFDTDCASATCHNRWENVGHARYRYNNTGIVGYSDGHAKSITKGQLKWYKNLYVPNSSGDGQWYGPGYAETPY